MKAVVLTKTGPPEVLQVQRDYPVPKRGAGQVLVRLKSTSVNPVDTYIRAGKMGDVPLPKVLGGDVAGVVEEADAGSKWKTGDAVFALTKGYWFDTPDGSYAEFAAVPEDWLAAVPPSLPLDIAGGVPLTALTAWQALQPASPKPGQKLLVLAASGGVGHLAVQFGKALGLHVTGVAGPSNVAWVKELGADEALDYSAPDHDAALQAAGPFDIVIDMVATDLAKAAALVAQNGGTYSHIHNRNTDRPALEALLAASKAGTGPAVNTVLVQPNGAQLAEIAKLIEEGKVKLVVAKSLPLEEAAAGHVQVESSHTRGKVVLTV